MWHLRSRNREPGDAMARAELPHPTTDTTPYKTSYTTPEAAELLGISAKTLSNWRWSGSPIPFVKIGRVIRYLGADLQTYVEGSRRYSTSNRGGHTDK